MTSTALTGKKYLVTFALPYANGLLHLGHALEYIQADTWVRFQRMLGNECHLVAGCDAHGTATMIKAQENNVAPEEWVERMRQAQAASIAKLGVGYDLFHTTHSDENRRRAESIYLALKDAGMIVARDVEQLYDTEAKIFLADRFVTGDCPRCGAQDQKGDNCEVCSATYQPTELKNPKSVYTGSTPELRTSRQLFFKLSACQDFLESWLDTAQLQGPIKHKLKEWFQDELKDWDISREAPYFGFEIPGETDKYFYVWLDAPIGYMASFEKFCNDQGSIDFDSFWKAGAASDTELHHFIGKDIINFHGLFWPAMLQYAGYRTPTGLAVHGFVTLNGEKMSKSRGTFILIDTYLEHLDADSLRYYYATKLNPTAEDVDLNLEDFRTRVNSDVVGKAVNIGSRCAGFLKKSFDNTLASDIADEPVIQAFQQQADAIAELYHAREYGKAMRAIFALADQANQFIDEQKPWVLAKTDKSDPAIQRACSIGINCFRYLMILLKPVMPTLAEKAEVFLNVDPLKWSDLGSVLENHTIANFKPLAKRIEPEQIQNMLDATKAGLGVDESADDDNTDDHGCEPIADEIDFKDFMKVDLRVAKIVNAEHVEGSDKLLRLELDVGVGTRQVFSGIKSHYQPDDLKGRLTVMVANLKPRKMRFGVSEGMVLCAGDDDAGLFLLNPDSGAQPGQRVL